MAKHVRSRRPSSLYWLALFFFALVFLVSGGLLLHRLWQDSRVQADFETLEQQILPAGGDAAAGADNTDRFAAITAMNPDFIGWISIEDTGVSFPVMYSPDRPDFYLRHNFSGRIQRLRHPLPGRRLHPDRPAAQQTT